MADRGDPAWLGRTEHHEFWPCQVSLLDPAVINPGHLHNPKQVTDAYLLALAVANGGRFVTFDRSIAVTAAVGAQERHLTIL